MMASFHPSSSLFASPSGLGIKIWTFIVYSLLSQILKEACFSAESTGYLTFLLLLNYLGQELTFDISLIKWSGMTLGLWLSKVL